MHKKMDRQQSSSSRTWSMQSELPLKTTALKAELTFQEEEAPLAEKTDRLETEKAEIERYLKQGRREMEQNKIRKQLLIEQSRLEAA